MKTWALCWLAGLGFPADELEDLHRPPVGTAQRISSADIGGSEDADGSILASGADVTIAEVAGPGVIRRIWLTIDSDDPYASRNVVLRAFWDGESDPSIEVPVGDFFAVGHGIERDVDSVPVRVSSEGRARACYWSMPFNQSARISLRNDSAFAMRSVHYHIDWHATPEPIEDLRTFHASYRQQTGGPGLGRFPLADIRGPGHYIGTVLSIASAEAGWPGEGDDLFFVDGDGEPTLHGTGLDDYFGEAWTLRESEGAYTGVPLWEGDGMGRRCSAYRWHVRDSIPFEKSLSVVFETRGWANRGSGWSIVEDRRDQFSGVAFWYQTEPHLPFPSLPAAQDRLPYREFRIELEEMVGEVVVPGGAPAPARVEGRFLAFGARLEFSAERRQDAQLMIPFAISNEREYALALRAVRAPTAGRFSVWLDGVLLEAEVDFRSERSRIDEVLLGPKKLAEGRHVLELRAIGDGPYGLHLDSFLLRW